MGRFLGVNKLTKLFGTLKDNMKELRSSMAVVKGLHGGLVVATGKDVW